MFRSLLGRHRHRTALGLALTASCVLMVLDHGRQADVARGLGATLYAPLHAAVRGVEEMRRLRGENRQLRRLVATLHLERQKFLDLRDEQRELRRLARFATDRFPVLLPCEVVGRSSDRLQDMLQLGRGTRDSIAADMPVAAYGGLVGRVRQVTAHRALVELLTSPGMAVSCRDERSGVIGILRGVRGNRLVLDRVDAVEDVLVGDPLVTSGLGGVYPRGIPVGVVTRVEKSLDGLFMQVEVAPHVEMDALRDVFIVQRLVDWEDEAVYGPGDTRFLANPQDPTRVPATGEGG